MAGAGLRKLLAACAVLLCASSVRAILPEGAPKLHIAGLFHTDEWQEIMAFRAAVERINMDKFVLPDVKLVPLIEVYSTLDSFAMDRIVCNITSQGVAAIFGPSSKELVNIVTSISETLEIPHILTHQFTLQRPTKYQINIAPDTKSLSKALVDVLEDMAWKTFTIIYEGDDALFRLQEVLKAHGPADSPVTLRRLGEGSDYRPLMKEIHNSTETRIILDISTDKIIELFQQARHVKMMGDYTSYLVASLDAHTLDYSEINSWITEERSIANITGLRLVDPKSPNVQNAVQDWIFSERLHGNTITLTPEEVKMSAALMYDAVHMFARSLHILNQTEPQISERPLSCETVDRWEHGERIVSYIKAKYSSPDNTDEGMTGLLLLEPEAGYRRTNFTLTLIQTNMDNATGTWNMSGIHLFRSVEELEQSTKEQLSKKIMRVVSRLGAPYLMKRENWTEGMGNEGLEGYCMDLIDEIARLLNFRYEFYLVKDGNYGKLLADKKSWDGLIKDLLDRKADLGICDLTITYDREKAVDFTMPFMNLGISILFSEAQEQPQNLFSFLSPLSTEVWIYMATAYIGVSLLLFMLARTSPTEWDNPHPCNPDPEELENTFDVLNSMWFSMGSLLQQGCDFLPKTTPGEWSSSPTPADPNPTILEYTLDLSNAIWHNVGSLMQQGSDIAPQAISTRMVAGLWWFFTMIMISSYTANLAAFLTSNLKDESISNAKDLASQNKIQYGSVYGGSTMSFFQNSNFSDYQRMWAAMETTKPTVFTKNNAEGVERVRNGKRDYAFIMESTGIEFEVEKNCDLKQVGGLLDSKGYGIAMPRNSPYRTLISGAVLRLQESGKLMALKELWWKTRNGGGQCQSEGTTSDADSNKLGMGNVGGVFLVLIYGCAVAFLMAVLEFVWNTRQVAIENKISPKEAFMSELKFAIRCSGTTKPVKPKTPTPSSSTSDCRSRSLARSLGRSLIQLDNFQRLVGGGADK